MSHQRPFLRHSQNMKTQHPSDEQQPDESTKEEEEVDEFDTPEFWEHFNYWSRMSDEARLIRERKAKEKQAD